MAVPDPRAFALHKLWLAGQPDRNPLKKRRDENQGLAVAQLIIRYLPQYRFRTSDNRMFSKNLVESARDRISDSDIPFDFEV